ncbi:hypothetical protein TYRP_011728, partial [Tyrophagus putrescentiae]
RKDASDLGRHLGGALHEEALGGFGQHVAVDAVADQSLGDVDALHGVPVRLDAGGVADADDADHRLAGLRLVAGVQQGVSEVLVALLHHHPRQAGELLAQLADQLLEDVLLLVALQLLRVERLAGEEAVVGHLDLLPGAQRADRPAEGDVHGAVAEHDLAVGYVYCLQRKVVVVEKEKNKKRLAKTFEHRVRTCESTVAALTSLKAFRNSPPGAMSRSLVTLALASRILEKSSDFASDMISLSFIVRKHIRLRQSSSITTLGRTVRITCKEAMRDRHRLGEVVLQVEQLAVALQRIGVGVRRNEVGGGGLPAGRGEHLLSVADGAAVHRRMRLLLLLPTVVHIIRLDGRKLATVEHLQLVVHLLGRGVAPAAASLFGGGHVGSGSGVGVGDRGLLFRLLRNVFQQRIRLLCGGGDGL